MNLERECLKLRTRGKFIFPNKTVCVKTNFLDETTLFPSCFLIFVDSQEIKSNLLYSFVTLLLSLTFLNYNFPLPPPFYILFLCDESLECFVFLHIIMGLSDPFLTSKSIPGC